MPKKVGDKKKKRVYKKVVKKRTSKPKQVEHIIKVVTTQLQQPVIQKKCCTGEEGKAFSSNNVVVRTLGAIPKARTNEMSIQTDNIQTANVSIQPERAFTKSVGVQAKRNVRLVIEEDETPVIQNLFPITPETPENVNIRKPGRKPRSRPQVSIPFTPLQLPKDNDEEIFYTAVSPKARKNSRDDLLQRYENLTGDTYVFKKGEKVSELKTLVERMELNEE